MDDDDLEEVDRVSGYSRGGKRSGTVKPHLRGIPKRKGK